jgi:hypothetical protein
MRVSLRQVATRWAAEFSSSPVQLCLRTRLGLFPVGAIPHVMIIAADEPLIANAARELSLLGAPKSI